MVGTMMNVIPDIIESNDVIAVEKEEKSNHRFLKEVLTVKRMIVKITRQIYRIISSLKNPRPKDENEKWYGRCGDTHAPR